MAAGQSYLHYKQLYLFFPSQTTPLEMNVDYSYVRVPATTQEVIEKDHDHNHPIKSSETHTLAGSEAPAALKLSAPPLVGLFLLSIARNINSWL